MAEASSSWSNDMFFQQALLHVLGRGLGIEDVNTEEDSPLSVVRHVAFLSSAVLQLVEVFGTTQLNNQENQTLAETVRQFILNPLRKLQAQAEKQKIPAMDDWKAWSAEHGFDVQACLVLVVFIRVAEEVDDLSSASGSSYEGYNSLTLRARFVRLGFTHGAGLIRSLIGAFPPTRIMTPKLREVFEKQLDKASAQIKLRTLDEQTRAGTFVFPRTTVAIVRYLDTGSYDGLKLDKPKYILKTGLWVDDPPRYKAQSAWEQDPKVPDCIIL